MSMSCITRSQCDGRQSKEILEAVGLAAIALMLIPTNFLLDKKKNNGWRSLALSLVNPNYSLLMNLQLLGQTNW